MPDLSLYRPCVGIMLLNKDSLVFVGQRLDDENGYWQMPQGGINDNEDPESAAMRELYEETSITQVKVIATIDDWLCYTLPISTHIRWNSKYIGQKQKWFLMSFAGEDEVIHLKTDHPEFRSWAWHDITALPHEVISFKQQIYRTVIKRFQKHLGHTLVQGKKQTI